MQLPSPQPLIRALTLRLLVGAFFLCGLLIGTRYLPHYLANDLFASWSVLLFGCLFLLFFGLLQVRLCQTVVLRWWRQASAAAGESTAKKKAPKAEASKAEALQKQRQEQRMLLYLLTLLQREGRLMDFLGEDLSVYDDNQIGMAVRSIQENCKAAVDKQLHPKAVMDAEEESEVTVASGFDPNAIKLVGNVTGEPPFKGILRHKGWRATGMEIPALADKDDPLVIAPAEVEIL
jgi:hypothetical protein